MEDPRLSRLYAKALAREANSLGTRGETWLRRRRNGLRWLAFLLTVFALAFGYYAHIRGRFGRLKTELQASPTPQSHPLLLGGQEPLVLERAPLNDASTPELLSATFLPGKGMGLLQLTAMIPGRGVTSLLQAPSVEDLERAEQQRDTSLRMPPSLELPWAGTVSGGGPGDDSVGAEWHGLTLHLPATGAKMEGVPVSAGGLLASEASEGLDRNVMPDGGSTEAHFSLHSMGGRWPSNTDAVVTALLSGRALDLKIVARNTGSEPEPMGIGWIPAIQLPSGARAQATLRIPSTATEEMRNGRATGNFTDVAGSLLDFSAPGGKALEGTSLDTTFARLKTGFLDNGPVLELRDPAADIGLRMTSFSSQIQAVQVHSGADSNVIQVGFQTNLDDPFSPVWRSDRPVGITVLQPGQTLMWHVRFELMALTPTGSAPL